MQVKGMLMNRVVRSLGALAAFWAVFTAAADVAAVVVEWRGNTDGFWHHPANWSPRLPDALDDVTIDRTGNITVTHSSTSTPINSLVCKENLVLSGGDLPLAAASTIDGKLTLSGGILSGDGDLTLGGGVSWTASGMRGVGKTTIGAGSTCTVGGTLVWVEERSLENAGTIVLASTEKLVGTRGPSLANLAGGTIDVQSDGDVEISDSHQAAITNLGTFKKSAGTGLTEVEWKFDNMNRVDVESGALYFNGGGTSNGSFSTAAGTELLFGGEHVLTGSSFTNLGRITLANSGSKTTTFTGDIAVSGDVSVNGNLTVHGDATFDSLRFTGGALGGSGTTVIPSGGSVEISGTSPQLGDGRTFRNGGTAVFIGGSRFLGGDNAVWDNLDEALFDIRGDGSLEPFFPHFRPTFNNVGTLRKSGGGGTSSVAWSVNNSGTIENQQGTLEFTLPFYSTGTVDAQSGTLQISGGGVSNGNFAVAAGAELLFSGNHNLTGATFNNQGTIALADSQYMTTVFNRDVTIDGAVTLAGNLTVNGVGTFHDFQWQAGSLAGAGRIRIRQGGTLDISAAEPKLAGRQTFENLGTAYLTGPSRLLGGNGAVWENLPGSVFDVRGDGGLGTASASYQATFNNAGTFRKSAGAGTSDVNWKFNNSGALVSQTGTLRFFDTVDSTGTIDVTGGVLEFFGGGTSTGEAADVTVGPNGVLRFDQPFAFEAGASLTSAGSLETTATTLTLRDDVNLQSGSELVAALGSSANGRISTGADFIIGDDVTLTLEPVGVGAPGEITRTLIAARSVVGTFDNVPPVHVPGSNEGSGHLGLGVFHQGIDYVVLSGSVKRVTTSYLVAAGGDSNADQNVDGQDIFNLIKWFSRPGDPPNRTWLQCDTAGGLLGRGDGIVDGQDITALISNFTGDAGPVEPGSATAQYDPATGEFNVSVDGVMSWSLNSGGQFNGNGLDGALDLLSTGGQMASANQNTVGAGSFSDTLIGSDVALGQLAEPGTDPGEFSLVFVSGFGQQPQQGTITVVPEPGTAALLVGALAGLLLLWRRRR